MGSHDGVRQSPHKANSTMSTGTSKPMGPEELQRVANATLREAMINERSRKWHKVVLNYKQLVRMLNKRSLPPSIPIPTWHSMLMYEVFYHLGIACQNVGEHRKAVAYYSKAIESVFVPKNGCQAGCNSNSCLMTPIYARRAFAYAKAGDIKNGLRDAEKTVVLDNQNPDVYCIRAMVRSTRHENAMALQDTKTALRYNPSHLCALILKGRLATPQVYDEWLDPGKKSENEAHKKACSINPDCHNFLQVQDFNHHDIMAFYERFLYSLSVPHTICEIVLLPRKSPDSRISSAKSTDPRISPSRLQGLASDHASQCGGRPFRCGTPGIVSLGGAETVQRRKVYGEAVREHTSRPKTAEQCIAYLEKQRLKKQIADAKGSRVKPPPSSDAMHPKSGDSSWISKTSGADSSSVRTQSAKKPVVFQDMNIKEAPRMYYRPWLGDKLPIAEVERKQWMYPPFK